MARRRRAGEARVRWLASCVCNSARSKQTPTTTTMNSSPLKLTNARRRVPLHSDKQDTLILQTQGQKRWRIYDPPHQSGLADGSTWIYNRGKDGNVLREEESPAGMVLDVVLVPGDALFDGSTARS